MYELERAMAAMVGMSSVPDGAEGVKVTITLSRETMLYELLSNAFEYARSQCWDEDPEDDDPAGMVELRPDPWF